MIALWLATAFAGTWHLQLEAASEAKVPVLGWQKSVTETHALVWLSDGGSWTHEVCTVAIHDRAPLAETRLPDAFIEALPLTTATAEVKDEALRVDLGVARIGFGEGSLPLSADDPRVFDHEDDGRPGATVMLHITGFGTFGVDVVQSSHAVLTGTYNAGRYEGTIETLHLEQFVLDADHRMLRNTPLLRPRDDRSSFRLSPTAATDCGTLRPNIAED
ncbi:MAG: hypothetical protein KC912_18390 [Proteobacteria bacterium]|nr:hypothetical protein [Pseudomonadota bacterium]